jgi:single-strand DNA-binding protein
MSDLCSVTLTGNLTRDPELRETRGGATVCRMRLAYARRIRGAEGDWSDRANYVDLTAFGRQAEACVRHLGKGSRVGVLGELRWSEFETRNGVSAQRHEVLVREIQFLSPPERLEDSEPKAEASRSQPEPAALAGGPDDDIPF